MRVIEIMLFNFTKIFGNKSKKQVTIFSESVLKTSFYEELQKNGWVELDDGPDDLESSIRLIDKEKK